MTLLDTQVMCGYYRLVTTKYLISSPRSNSDEWFDQVTTHKGIKEITRDLKYVYISSSDEVIGQLLKKYPHFKIEKII